MNEPRVVQLELSGDELSLLELQLRRRLDDMDRELIRTEKRVLQHAIAKEVQQLEALLKRLQNAITQEASAPTLR